MPEILGRIKSGFFAILLPGFFLTVVSVAAISTAAFILWTVSSKLGLSSEPNIHGTFDAAWNAVNKGWLFPLLTLATSFLFGSAIWARKMNTTDDLTVSKYLQLTDFKNIWRLTTRRDKFPYPKLLILTHEHLSKANLIGDYLPELPAHRKRLGEMKKEFSPFFERNLKEKKTEVNKTIHSFKLTDHYLSDDELQETTMLHSCFNYWKTILSQNQPAAFALCKEYESRARLFAGMYWAGTWGLVISMIGAILGLILIFMHGFVALTIVSSAGAGISFAVKRAFGRGLRGVRTQEVVATYSAYSAYCSSIAKPSNQHVS